MIPEKREAGYESLAITIINDCIHEYEIARRKFLRGRNDGFATTEMRNLCNFFHSQWCGILSFEIEHDVFLQKLYQRFPELEFIHKNTPWQEIHQFLKNNRIKLGL